MDVQSQTGEVCALVADIDRASTLITGADPATLEEFSARLDSAATRLRGILARGLLAPAQAADVALRIRKLNALFNHATAFYCGWAAMAGVADSDRAVTSISLEG